MMKSPVTRLSKTPRPLPLMPPSKPAPSATRLRSSKWKTFPLPTTLATQAASRSRRPATCDSDTAMLHLNSGRTEIVFSVRPLFLGIRDFEYNVLFSVLIRNRIFMIICTERAPSSGRRSSRPYIRRREHRRRTAACFPNLKAGRSCCLKRLPVRYGIGDSRQRSVQAGLFRGYRCARFPHMTASR